MKRSRSVTKILLTIVMVLSFFLIVTCIFQQIKLSKRDEDVSNIDKYLSDIMNTSLGKDVSQAIHDGIEEYYKDGKADAIDLEARGSIEETNAALAEYWGETEAALALKADKTELAIQFNFKGSCLFSELPVSGVDTNDTWYVTDKKCNYSWNGEKWFQSSMNESDYQAELTKISNTNAELKSDLSDIKENIADIDGMRLKINDIIEEEHSTNSTNIFDGDITRGNFIDNEGKLGKDSNMCYTNTYYPVAEGELITAGYGDNTQARLRFVTAYDFDKNVLSSSGVNGGYLYKVPANVAYVRFTFYISDVDSATFRINKGGVLLPYEPNMLYVPKGYNVLGERIDGITESRLSTNIFDGDITRGQYINTDGTVGKDSNMCYTNTYYSVQENDKLLCGTGDDTKAQLRYVTAYDSDKKVISSGGISGGFLYTVPANVAYVRFTFYISDVDSETFRLNKSAFLLPYESHDTTTVPRGYNVFENVSEQPLTALPDYVLGCMSYRPLGQLSKPYICLVSDDGDEDMITYSIPMVVSKGVPCTWAIMSTSEIFRGDDAEANVASVLDSVDNHGCAIAQHGGTNWTEYTEKDLNEFFEREKDFMSNYGLEAKSAVIPSHYMSELVCAIAGGKYGVVRTGFYGENPAKNTKCEELVKAYPYYTCGARTNVFALTSQNLANISQEQAQSAIDYAKANNLLIIFYWHENSLDDGMKTRIEDAIDYAKEQGIEFITLDKVATIN